LLLCGKEIAKKRKKELARARDSCIFAPCSSERLLKGGQNQRLENENKLLTARAARSKTRPAFEIVTQMPSRQDGIGTEVFCPLNGTGKPNGGGTAAGQWAADFGWRHPLLFEN